MTVRIKQLEQFVKDDPDDPFNIYALALEYQKFDIPRALALFEQLVTHHLNYLPTYYQLAKLYEVTGDTDKAILTFEKGRIIAQSIGDYKAMRELKSASSELDQ